MFPCTAMSSDAYTAAACLNAALMEVTCIGVTKCRLETILWIEKEMWQQQQQQFTHPAPVRGPSRFCQHQKGAGPNICCTNYSFWTLFNQVKQCSWRCLQLPKQFNANMFFLAQTCVDTRQDRKETIWMALKVMKTKENHKWEPGYWIYHPLQGLLAAAGTIPFRLTLQHLTPREQMSEDCCWRTASWQRLDGVGLWACFVWLASVSSSQCCHCCVHNGL